MSSGRELVAEGARQLAAAGVGSPRVDAELLLAALLGVPRARATLHDAVPPAVTGRYRAHVARRAAREPLQHIVGEAPFRHLMLKVGPGVFVPRPETELLIDAVLPRLRALPEPLAVDLCSGSGALAAAIADEAPAARVVAVERSAAALRWLARNVPPSVQVLAADVADPDLLRDLCGCVDVVVCNPPYVPAAAAVQPEVRADPAEAVFAGASGLDLIPSVVRLAGRLLAPDGVFAMEHDETHASDVLALLRADAAWDDVAGHDDLTGRPRYVTARRAFGKGE